MDWGAFEVDLDCPNFEFSVIFEKSTSKVSLEVIDSVIE